MMQLAPLLKCHPLIERLSEEWEDKSIVDIIVLLVHYLNDTFSFQLIEHLH